MSLAHRAALLGVLALVGTAGCAPSATPPPPRALATPTAPAPPPPAEVPSPEGVARVALPDPVVAWDGSVEGDLAALDLAAVWSLPLHRVDADGRLRPGLALDATTRETTAGWVVDVTLAPGTWSDGRPVVAADVVATVEVLRRRAPSRWSALRRAEAPAPDHARLVFDRPFHGWPWLFVGPPGILPAHVLAQRGAAAYAQRLPVTGGPFLLVADERGVEQRWRAHAGSPLGAPRLAGLRTSVVPDLDVALGLLDEDRLDVATGHVALDPVGRARDAAGVEVATAFGGTSLELWWVEGPDGGVARRAQRRRVAAAVDATTFRQGLLRRDGRAPSGTLPGTAAPGVVRAPSQGAATDAAVRLLVPRTVGPLGLLGRLVRRDVPTTTLVLVDPPAHLEQALDPDARLLVARRWPVPSAAAALTAAGLDPGAGLEADAAGPGVVVPVGVGQPAPPPWQDVDRRLAAAATRLRLAEVAPTTAWVPTRLTGVSASGWPGLALWDVVSWEARP